MRTPRRLRDAVSNILMVAALVIIWMLFAPVKLGGQVSYVLVNGTSMLPNFHTGDLVLVRKEPAYQVGDVVTYHDPLMNADIIHRIIGLQGTHFVIKGDNNSWIDAYYPISAEILGKLWLHLPKFGAALLFIRTPLNMALEASLLGGYFMVTTIAKKPNKNSRSKNIAGNLAGFEVSLYLFGLLALGFLALVIFAFIRPATLKANNIPYQQTGIFAYSAAGTSTVYDSGAAISGEPVFTKLTCNLNLAFAYTLQGAQLKNISGTQKIFALLQDQQSGWHRTIPLTTATKFTGNTSTSKTTLDLCQVASLVNAVEQATGVSLNSYTLVIIANISVGGKISGQAFTDTFDPRLAFGFDGLHLYISGNSSQTNPMQTVQPGSAPNSNMVENIFPLFGLKPTVGKIRLVALIGLGSTLAGLLALGIYSYSVSRRSEESIIHLKYSNLLMGVREAGLESLSPIIDVTSIEDLAHLAERQNAMIMHLTHEDVHYYLVQIEGKTYRYMTGQERSANSG
jgi:signal peptidase I